MSRRILVTGQSGFVGGKLAERLRQLGWDVTGIGRRSLDLPGYRSLDLARPLPDDLGTFDVVVHAAARSNPWGTAKQYEADNVTATQNVIDHCLKQGQPKLIYISSSSVYYRSEDQFGLTEASPMPDHSVNRYAATKRRGEELTRRYAGDWAILRPRAVFGPGDTVLLPRIVAAAEQGRLPLLVPSGDPVVGDLIYIDNLVDYIIKAAEDPAISGDFNLTNNEPVPILEFLLDVLKQLEVSVPTRRVHVRKAMLAAGALEFVHRLFMPRREPAITRFGVHVFAYSKTFDVSKSIAAMGEPRISNQEGVNHAVQWMKQDRHEASP